MERYGNAPGKPIIGGARAYYWGSFLDIDQKDPNARWRKYQAMPPLKGPNGVQYAAWNYLGVGVEVATLVITKKCAKPELLVQWADAQMELEAILRGYGGPDSSSGPRRASSGSTASRRCTDSPQPGTPRRTSPGARTTRCTARRTSGWPSG